MKSIEKVKQINGLHTKENVCGLPKWKVLNFMQVYLYNH